MSSSSARLNDSLQTPAVDNVSCASTSVLVISQDVMFSGLSVIVPSGLILNALSLVVFMSRAMRRRASSWYLAALAASDSLSLISVSFDYWLKDSRIGLQVLYLLCYIVLNIGIQCVQKKETTKLLHYFAVTISNVKQTEHSKNADLYHGKNG